MQQTERVMYVKAHDMSKLIKKTFYYLTDVKTIALFSFWVFYITQPHEPLKWVKMRSLRAANGCKIRLIIACKARLLLFPGSKSPISCELIVNSPYCFSSWCDVAAVICKSLIPKKLEGQFDVPSLWFF